MSQPTLLLPFAPGNPLTDRIGAAMRHLSARQQVIAGNIANADTPGYKAREMDAPAFAAQLDEMSGNDAMDNGMMRRPMVRVSAEMRALGSRAGAGGVIRDRDILETKPDGNNVTLEEQLMKMGAIQADFTALTRLYAKQMALVKTALGKGGG